MAITKDFGPLFFHFAKTLPRTRLIGVVPTQELEPPFRRSDSLLIRFFPLNIAIVLGRWKASGILNEEEALLIGMQGRNVGDVSENDEVKQNIRERIGRERYDLDMEWQIIESLGIQ